MSIIGLRRAARYLLVVLLVALATVTYAKRRDLLARYIEHEVREEQVSAVKQQCEDLQKEIDSSRRRVENLGGDPLEIEAAIRRSKDLVREGEKVYRIETGPAEATKGAGGSSGQAAP
jgi:cell division protein FtsB